MMMLNASIKQHFIVSNSSNLLNYVQSGSPQIPIELSSRPIVDVAWACFFIDFRKQNIFDFGSFFSAQQRRFSLF